MAYVDIHSWTPEYVVNWTRGLHKSLETVSSDKFVEKRINGDRLILLDAQDIIDLIPTICVEALQSILEGIKLLRYLTCESESETLQSLMSQLAAESSYLYNQLVQAEHSPKLLPVTAPIEHQSNSKDKENKFNFAKVDSNMQINMSTKQRVSLETLASVSVIVEKIIHVVEWLKSTTVNFNQLKFSKDVKDILLRCAVELTSTAQRDLFVEKPNDILKKTSKFLAEYSEWFVFIVNDPDFIQPCWLDVVSIKKKREEPDYGIRFYPSLVDSLTIEKVIFSLPAHRSGRIAKGDQVIQVGYQTVVNWPLERVERLLETSKSELILTIKRRPTQTSINPALIILKPYAISLKRLLSHNSESIQSAHDTDSLNRFQANKPDDEEHNDELELEGNLEPPKEPKGPVYELRPVKPKGEVRRRASISGNIADALVDLSLADSLPIPSFRTDPPSLEPSPPLVEQQNNEKKRLSQIAKETLTKSVSHDTAKLYVHAISVDQKYLWLPPKRGN